MLVRMSGNPFSRSKKVENDWPGKISKNQFDPRYQYFCEHCVGVNDIKKQPFSLQYMAAVATINIVSTRENEEAKDFILGIVDRVRKDGVSTDALWMLCWRKIRKNAYYDYLRRMHTGKQEKDLLRTKYFFSHECFTACKSYKRNGQCDNCKWIRMKPSSSTCHLDRCLCIFK